MQFVSVRHQKLRELPDEGSTRRRTSLRRRVDAFSRSRESSRSPTSLAISITTPAHVAAAGGRGVNVEVGVLTGLLSGSQTVSCSRGRSRAQNVSITVSLTWCTWTGFRAKTIRCCSLQLKSADLRQRYFIIIVI